MPEDKFIPPSDSIISNSGFTPPSDAVETPDPQKKSPPQTTPASQSSATNSTDAQSQGSRQQNASGYDWSNGDKGQTPFATGGVQGMNNEALFSTETAEKLNGESPNTYVAKKGVEYAKLVGDLEEHKTSLQSLNHSFLTQQYQSLNTQLQAMNPNDPRRDALQGQINELRKQPFQISPETWKELNDTQDMLKEKRLPPEMQNVKTVGEAADILDGIGQKISDTQAKIQQNITDANNVIQPLRDVHGIKIDKDGYHQLGLYGSFMNGFMGNLSNIAKAASFIGATPEKKQQILQDDMGANIIDPEKANPIAQSAGGLSVYIIPGLGIEAAGAKGTVATIGNAFINSTMMGLSGGYENASSAYRAALAQTNDPNVALQKADDAFKTGSATGAIVGGIGLPLAGKLGEHVALGMLSKETVEAAMQDGKLSMGNLSLAEYAAYTLPKNAIANLPFPLAKIIDNKFAQARGENVGTMDNVASTYFGAMLMGHFIDGLSYGGEKLTPAVKETYQNMVAKYGNEGFQQSISKAVTDGEMTQQQADAIAQPINDKAMAFAEMPKDLSPEMEDKVLPLIQQKNELIKQQSENKVLPDEHYDHQIESLDRKISETMGTPLTTDEQGRMSKLKEQANEEGKLNKVDRAELNHYEARIKSADDIATEEKKVIEVRDAKKDRGIEFAQKENGLPTSPDLNLTPDANDKLRQIEEGKLVTNNQRTKTNENLQPLIDELNDKISTLSKTRDNPNRQYSRAQIDDTITDLKNKVSAIEAARKSDSYAKPMFEGVAGANAAAKNKNLDGEKTNSAENAAPVKVGDAQFTEHGEDKLTADDKENGTGNSKLTDTGKREASKQGQDIASEQPNLKTIYTSDVTRSKQTGDIAAESAGKTLGKEVEVKEQPLLATWNIGDAEGDKDGSFDEHKWADKPDEVPPGGESWNSFAERSKKAWQWAKTLGDDAHGITHSKVTRMFEALNESGGDMAKAKELFFKSLDAENSAKGETMPDGKKVGNSHESMQRNAADLGVGAPERGAGTTALEQMKRGRDLLADGAKPETLMQDYKDGKIPIDDAIAMAKAHQAELAQEVNKAIKDKGVGSAADIAAKAKLDQWQKDTKPLATVAHKAFVGLQGETDVDTGDFASSRAKWEETLGRPLNESENKKLKDLTDKYNSEVVSRIAAEQKLDELKNEAVTEPEKPIEKPQPKLRGKDLIASGVEDLAKALGAIKSAAGERLPEISKAVGKIARGLLDEGIATADNVWEKVKDYVKDRMDKDLSENYAQDAIAEVGKSLEEKNVTRLEKQLKDLQENRVKEKGKKREPSENEIALKQSIQKEKERLGLVEPEKNIHTQFLDHKGNEFSPNDAKDIWDYVKKSYLRKGEILADAIAKTAKDLALSPEQVMHAIASDKTTRKATDDLILRQRNERNAMFAVKDTVNQKDQALVAKTLKKIFTGVFSEKVLGHGGVGMFTHASTALSRPELWSKFFPAILTANKYSYEGLTKAGAAKYELAMSALKNRPNWAKANVAGLRNDPYHNSTDYSKAETFLGRFGEMGKRGFSILPEFRQDMFDHFYNKLSDGEKADPNVIKAMASQINNATGYNDALTPKNETAKSVLEGSLFSPKLLAAKWDYTIGEPARAVITYGKALPVVGRGWNNISPSERAAANMIAKRVGITLGTYVIGLAINHGLLSVTGSKQKINVTDPSKPDWMKNKDGIGDVVALDGNTLACMHALYNLSTIFSADKRQELKGKTKLEAYSIATGKYLRGQLSPAVSDMADVATSHDFEGNTMPWSREAPDGKYAHKLTWTEYLANATAPIPIEEGIKNVTGSMHDQGVSDPDIEMILHGVAVGSISMFTGVRISKEPKAHN